MTDRPATPTAPREWTGRRIGGLLLIACGTALTAVKIILPWETFHLAIDGGGPQRGLVLSVLAAGAASMALGLGAIAVEVAGRRGFALGALATAMLVVMIVLPLFLPSGVDLLRGGLAVLIMIAGTDRLNDDAEDDSEDDSAAGSEPRPAAASRDQ